MPAPHALGCLEVFMFNIFGDVVFLMIDKFTDKVASYIKLKELEKRIKMND